MRHAWAACDAVRAGVEGETEVARVDFLGFVTHCASRRDHFSRDLEHPVAVRRERVLEVCEEVQEGYATTRPSWCAEAGICRVDGGRGSRREGFEDVGVFDGVGRD